MQKPAQVSGHGAKPARRESVDCNQFCKFIPPRIAAVVAVKAQELGLSKRALSREH